MANKPGDLEKFRELVKGDRRIWMIDFEKNGIPDEDQVHPLYVGDFLATKGNERGLFVLISQDGHMALGTFEGQSWREECSLQILYQDKLTDIDSVFIWLVENLKDEWFEQFTLIGEGLTDDELDAEELEDYLYYKNEVKERNDGLG